MKIRGDGGVGEGKGEIVMDARGMGMLFLWGKGGLEGSLEVMGAKLFLNRERARRETGWLCRWLEQRGVIVKRRKERKREG